jgi:esterase/lipase superfamily enzyme
MLTRKAPQTVRFFPVVSAKQFIVLDPKRTVLETTPFLRSAAFYWYIFSLDGTFYVLSRPELRDRLSSNTRSSVALTKALALRLLTPNLSVPSGTRHIDLPVTPGSRGGVPGRVVFLQRSRSGDASVMAVGLLKKQESKAPAPPSKVRVLRRVSMKKAAAKKAVSKKAHGRKRPALQTPAAKVGTFESVKVFYATDRKSSIGKNNQRVHYLNELETPAKLHYGVCNVTIPAKHKIGQLETPSIWRFWRFQFTENAEKHFTVIDCREARHSRFLQELRNNVRRDPSKSAFVFIHGYNVAFDDAAKKTAQLARDMKFPGAPILYSWASAAEKKKYCKDEEIIGLTQGRLQLFLEELRDRTGAEVVHVIAHSMGNRALLQALKLASTRGTQQRKFKQIVLTAPDVPRVEVESLLDAAEALADRVTLYASSKDKALLGSKWIHTNPRLGFVYDFPFYFSGLDSIDASGVHTDFMGHSVFSNARSVLGDLSELILRGTHPASRFALQALNTLDGLCWTFRP